MGAGASTDAMVICQVGDRVKVSAVRRAIQHTTKTMYISLGKANFKGKGTFYPGTVSKVNDNGTYSIDFDDGDKQNEVRAIDIRALHIKLPSPKKSDGTAGKKDDGLNLPPNLVPRLHRFWALLVQGLQCKAWRVNGKDVNAEALAAVEETNEVLWLLAHQTQRLAVGPDKTQTPTPVDLLFPLASLHAPLLVQIEGFTQPAFQLQNDNDTVVVGVDTHKSAAMLVQLIGEVLDTLAGKPVPETAPVRVQPPTQKNVEGNPSKTNQSSAVM
jgi:hypothetical protein